VPFVQTEIPPATHAAVFGGQLFVHPASSAPHDAFGPRPSHVSPPGQGEVEAT
jgi:hypothetical protein